MKQTAVEWLISQLFNESTVEVTKENNPDLFEVLEQAKAMEKQQIMDAWDVGKDSFSSMSAEEYYNKTFK